MNIESRVGTEPTPDRNRYQPDSVVREALSYIKEDDTIDCYDETESKWFASPVYEQVDVANLPPDRYAERLITVARSIMGAISHTHSESDEDRSNCMRILAGHLSAYRRDPYFLDHAASMLKVSEDGSHIVYPQLPEDPPYLWVPSSRNENPERRLPKSKAWQNLIKDKP